MTRELPAVEYKGSQRPFGIFRVFRVQCGIRDLPLYFPTTTFSLSKYSLLKSTFCEIVTLSPNTHFYSCCQESDNSNNNKKVLKVLKNSMMDPSPMVRINTIEALMNSEYDEAQDLIRTALKDEDEEVQRNALVAMYNLIGRDILDEVISLPGYSKFLKEEAQSMIDEYEEGGEDE